MWMSTVMKVFMCNSPPEIPSPPGPHAIVPHRITTQENEKIMLYEGEMEVETIHGLSPGKGKLVYVWQPSPSIYVEGNFRFAQVIGPGERSRFRFKVPGGSDFGEVLLPRFGTNPGQEFAAYGFGWSDGVIVGRPETTLQATKFCVPNFLSILGNAVWFDHATPPFGTHGRAKIINGDWQIILDPMADFNLFRQWGLERTAASALTHVGEITKLDGTTYVAAEMVPLLDKLAKWFSFCRGNWTAPILAVGYAADGATAWQDWRAHYVRPSAPVLSWANTRSSDFLETGFSLFCERCLHPVWNDALDLAIRWYVECVRQASGVESSIMLTQTGLELLSWAYLVEDLKAISNEGLKRLPAVDQLRVLLMTCGIPLSIPDNLGLLSEFASGRSILDGPECLVRLRNALVHSGKNNSEFLAACSFEIRLQIWKLSLWYFELVLLKVIGYTGNYRNRLLSEHQDEFLSSPLPWMIR